MFLRSITAGLSLAAFIFASNVSAQRTDPRTGQRVRTVTIPISIYAKQELERDKAQEFVQIDRVIVKEDKEDQTILSIRSVESSPLSLAVLIQEDLSSEFNLQLKDIASFIRSLPRPSRVMVAYIRGGSLRVKQRFTDDLEKAASVMQITSGTESANGPFDGVADATGLFEGLPSGRRAILLISDGLDVSKGGSIADAINSPELDRAITRAQRRSIAVYSIWSPTSVTQNGNAAFITAGQSALQKLSDETGGRSFYLGSIPAVSFLPYLKDLGLLLGRQFALTYLSTHMKKGYHRVDVTSTNPDVEIEHPKGYYYR